MAYDISMSSRDQVLALLNESAGLSLTWQQVEFDVPNINSNPAKERNTELVVNGIPDYGYKGQAVIYYNRIDLAEFEPLARNPFVVQVDVDPENESITLQDIVDGFNAYFNAALTLDDVADNLILPTDWANGESFTMKASPYSYAYIGEVTFIVRPMDVDIDVAITNKLLDGLELVQPA